MSSDNHGNNGDTRVLPALTIVLDPDTQDVAVSFDSAAVKTYEFALAMLEMARLKLDVIRRIAQAQEMKTQLEEAARTQRILHSVRGKV